MTAPPAAGRLLIRTLSGTSMLPLFRTGQRVGIEPAPAASIRRGEIIAFHAGGRVVLHRVIDVRRDGDRILFREKGDNRPFSTLVDAGQVLGRAVWREDEGVRTRLDQPRAWAIRLFTQLARVEAGCFDALRSVRLRSRRRLSPRSVVRLLRWLRVLMWPAKLLLAPLCLALYPRKQQDRGAATAAAVLAVARRLCGADTESEPAPPGLDGSDLLEALTAHGLAGLACDQLSAAFPGGVPEADMLREVRIRRYRGALTYGACRATLESVQRVLGEAGVPFVVLKGPPLAAEVYDDPTVRPSADLDVLVGPRDVDAARAALAATTHTVRGSTLEHALARRVHFHLVLDPRDDCMTKIELHWDLVDRANLYRIATDEVFARRRDVIRDGVACAVLSPEDLLIYLGLHIAKHGLFNRGALQAGRAPAWYVREASGNRMIWFVDLHRFLRRHGAALDWAAVRARCARWNVCDEVGETLRVLDLLLPDAQSRQALAALGLARAEVRDGTMSGGGAAGALMRPHPGLVIRPARLLAAGAVLFPSAGRLMRYYGVRSRWMLPLLYVRHPFHMARRLLFWERIA